MMKKWIMVVAGLMVWGPSAWACPNMAGSYKCSTQNWTQLITQSEKDGKTILVWGEGAAPMTVDGQSHSLGPVSYVVSCDDDSFHVEVTMPDGQIKTNLMQTDAGYVMTSTDPNHSNETWIKQ
jgi:hypothetical protein